MNITSKYRWIGLGFAGLLSTAAVIHAQSLTAAVAKVPFSFSIGNTRLPAATYRLSKVTTSGAMKIQDASNGHSIMFGAGVPKGGEATDSRLVFRCYGRDCFLAEVWYQGESSGHALTPAAREKEIAQVDRKNVIVAMR